MTWYKDKLQEVLMSEPVDPLDGIPDAMPDIMPDMPAPGVGPSQVEDDSKCGTVARKFAFIGVGQAGCTLCDAFYAMGYRRVLAISTTQADCANLKLPEENRLLIGTAGGSDKDREAGAAAMRSAREQVFEVASRMLGESFDRCLVLASAGGGTGSGGYVEAVSIADDLMQSLRLRRAHEATKVGVMLVLPSNSDGTVHAGNAVAALKDAEALVMAKRVSPMILVDNERLGLMFKSTMLDCLPTYNAWVVGLFHTLNVLAASTSRYSQVFDPAEYDSLLDSGVLSYGAVSLHTTGDELNDSLAVASMSMLSNAMVTPELDCLRATVAAGILTGPVTVFDKLPRAKFDTIVEALQRAVKGARAVHLGMYHSAKSPRIIVAVGGTPFPSGRIKELASRA